MGLFGSTSSRRSALLALFFVASSSAAAAVSAEFPDGFSCKETKDGVTGSAARYISAKPGVKDKVWIKGSSEPGIWSMMDKRMREGKKKSAKSKLARWGRWRRGRRSAHFFFFFV